MSCTVLNKVHLTLSIYINIRNKMICSDVVLLIQHQWHRPEHHSELAVTDLPVTVLVHSSDHPLYLRWFDLQCMGDMNCVSHS